MAIDWTKYNSEEMNDASWPEKGIELQVGDSIEGRYIGKKEKVGRNNSNVYTIETADGKKVGVWGSTVLDSKFQNIGEGKMVAIQYVGIKKGKTGSTYKDFKCGVGIDKVGDEGDNKVPF